MTTIESAINENTATQVDIDDVVPTPIDTLKSAVAALAKAVNTKAKQTKAANELREQIDAVRGHIATAATDGNDDGLQALTKDLRKLNNKLDKALDDIATTELDIPRLKLAVTTALEVV
jgi:DNA-binding transcriptional MerR regulator